ncbi:hypothetical protein SAMN05518848_107129 [Paenibacillus sp. PDC88]|nr:hypothetical protein SAMN05518848_107129 [Paenibacillus sp. PDC88]
MRQDSAAGLVLHTIYTHTFSTEENPSYTSQKGPLRNVFMAES